jgi:branched-chain amino acid transport system permease protein
MILQFFFNGLALGAIYAVIAFGFGLIYTTTKIFHIAHAAVFTATSYIFYTLVINFQLNFYISVIVATLLGGCLGVLMEVWLYRPLGRRKATSSIYIIASLGVYIVVQNVISMIFGNQNLFINTEPADAYRVGTIIIDDSQILNIVFGLLFSIICYFFLKKTNLGKDIAAFADNSFLAEILGFNIRFLRLAIFFIGSCLSGFGAILLAINLGIDPHFGLNIILISLVAVTVGGISVLAGGAIGGLSVGILQGVIAVKVPAQWETSAMFLLLVIFLLFRPYGLVGKKRRIEELL